MPGSPGSVFPSMTHMVIPCLLLAEVYLIDCPHNSRWWANKCSGGVTVQNINCWKRDVLVTMKYWLYVEPTKHFVNWTRQVKKLAFNLFGQNAWQYHMGSLNSTSSSNKMITKKPSSPSSLKNTKTNDRPVDMEISTTNTDTTDQKESKEIVASKKIISNTKSSTLETIAEITNSKSIPNNTSTNTNTNMMKTSPSKSDVSKISKSSKIKTNTTQKTISRNNSSSFHRSLHNHLNASSGLYKNNNSNYFSIQNLLSSNFPFNKPNNLSSNSVLATASATSLLNVINNNASCKMASPTGGTSFKLLSVRDSTGNNSNNGASTSGTVQRKRPVSMPPQSSVNGRMSITNMVNNATSSAAGTASTKSFPTIPTRRNSYSLYQSPAAMYSSMDNNTPTSSTILGNIGRSHTIKFTSSRFSGGFDKNSNSRSTLSSTLALIRENSEEHKNDSSKPRERTYSNDSERTRCNTQIQNQSINNGRFLANSSLISELTCVPTTTSSISVNKDVKDENMFTSPTFHVANPVNTTTTSSSYISNNNDSAYQHLKSYLKSTSDLSYSGCNGQKIENSLLSNLGLPSRQDSRMSSNFSFLGKSQPQQHNNQASSSLIVQPPQYPSQNQQQQQQQSSFQFANSQKPPPQPITNSIAMHNSTITQDSSNRNTNGHVDLPPSLEATNQAPTKFHYPFQSSRSSRNKNVNQSQIQIPPQFQNPNSLLNTNQGQNQDINYQNSYEVPTPGRSNSDSSNVPSIYSSTNVTPFSPKSFTSSELNSTLSTTTVSRNNSLNTTITTSSYESNNTNSKVTNNENDNKNINIPPYMDYKKMAYLPSNFNPHCSKNIEEPSSLNNSNYVEQNNTIFKDPYFKNLVINELENSSSQVSHESFRSDSMEIDEEKKILSPPTTPN